MSEKERLSAPEIRECADKLMSGAYRIPSNDGLFDGQLVKQVSCKYSKDELANLIILIDCEKRKAVSESGEKIGTKAIVVHLEDYLTARKLALNYIKLEEDWGSP
ncbi:MAG: hypothetical protein ABIH76_06350 [Candidatus Bathyarchaeota archaeon]